MAGVGKIVVKGPALLAAQSYVADMVSCVAGCTMGPSGKTVGIGKEHGGAKATKDGVTTIKELKFSNNVHQALLHYFQEGSNTMTQNCGDATTTYNVLTCSMLGHGIALRSAGISIPDVKNGICKARDVVLEYISASTRPISRKQDMYNIAYVSSNCDSAVSEVIADVLEAIGTDGVATVEEGKTLKTVDFELLSGMSFTQGYISPYFVTNSEKMVAELENPVILVINKKISSAQQILPILEGVVQSGKPLLIIAEDVDGEALATLIVNKMRGGLKVCAVKAPGFGERRVAMLEDIAILTGAQLITDELGLKPENLTMAMLGSAKKVNVHKDKVVMVGSSKDKSDAVTSRIEAIRRLIDESTSDYDKEKLRERIAKLAGGVAVIRVGGATEAEVKERKDRYEDALNATRAAVESGIVVGGGIALYNARKALSNLKMNSEAEQAGVSLVYKALSSCMERILLNAGHNGSVIANKLDEMNDSNQVFNARTGQYVNAFDDGVVDAAKGVIMALKTAVSTATMLIDMAVLLVDEQEDSSNGRKLPAGAGGGYGSDMDF